MTYSTRSALDHDLWCSFTPRMDHDPSDVTNQIKIRRLPNALVQNTQNIICDNGVTKAKAQVLPYSASGARGDTYGNRGQNIWIMVRISTLRGRNFQTDHDLSDVCSSCMSARVSVVVVHKIRTKQAKKTRTRSGVDNDMFN